MAEQNPVDLVRRATTLSLLWGVSLIILGVLAVGAPMIAAVAVNAVISWLIVLAGVVHLAVAFHRREAGSMIWRALVGLAYIFFGVYLIAHPTIAVASLTLVLASLFLVEGIFDIALFFQARAIRGAARSIGAVPIRGVLDAPPCVLQVLAGALGRVAGGDHQREELCRNFADFSVKDVQQRDPNRAEQHQHDRRPKRLADVVLDQEEMHWRRCGISQTS